MRWHLLTLPVCLLLLASCSGRSTSPTAPQLADEPVESTVIPSEAPLVTHEFAGMSSGAGMLGAYTVDLTLGETPTAQLEPLRATTAIADTYLVDVSTILRSAPCGDCLQVSGISLKDGAVHVTFELAHPFQSTAARKDLHVFDVRGHVISGRSVASYPGIMANLGAGNEPVVANGRLVTNADGYSTFFDGVAEGFLGVNVPGNTRPYKFFWKDLGAGNVNANNPTGWGNIEAPTGHNVFPMGGTRSDARATATYALNLNPGDSGLSFLFMVDAAYGVSAVLDTRLTPRYFLPLFNQVAPVVLTASVASGELNAGDPNSSLVLDVKVGDWQAGLVPPDLGFNPATSKLNDIAFTSDLAGLLIDVPGVLNAPKSIDPSTFTSGNGTPSNPYVFNVTIANEQSAVEGDYLAILAAQDEATAQISEGPVSLNRDAVTPDDNYHDFTTYQFVPLVVNPVTNLAPEAELTADRTTVGDGGQIEFCPGPGSMDPDGSIVLWEYDFDWDGVPANFVADTSRTPADSDKCATTTFANGTLDILTVTVGMRVTDDGDPQLKAIDSLEITVTPIGNDPPTAELVASTDNPFTGSPVSFMPGPGTGDPDGTLILYEYDFDWDGVPANFTADVSGPDPDPVQHTYTNPGTTDLEFTAAMRVTDDGTPGLTALDSVLITVRPVDPTPVWDFENPADTLDGLGFTLLGTNGLERGPIAPCQASKNYSNDPPSSYNAPPAGSTWGLTEGIGDADYPGNSTARALDESGSTATPGEDNRYWSDAIYAIRTPVIPLPDTSNNLFLDLHHWFETDFDYEVDAVPPGGTSPFTFLAMPDPGKVTNFDGATVWVREAPGGVPAASATRLDVLGPQASEPFWVTFDNATGYRWEMLTLFTYTPFVESENWLQTNYMKGVDRGFAGMSYTNSVTDKRHAVPDAGVAGLWKVNPAQAQWIDSRFDLSPWEGKEIVIEFRFASKKKTNEGCRTTPSGTTLYPPCIECMQNLEALVDTSVNHRRSKGWRIDRIEVLEES